jgi:spore maturation protein A
MIMSWIWTGILVVSIIFSFVFQKSSELAAAIPLGAQKGLELSISIGGSLCLWSGLGALMEFTGITKQLCRLFRPLLHCLFPATKQDSALLGYLSGNVCANFLGLGNAATPMGIQAARRLVDPRRPHIASDQLCRLIVLNTASIQLIPSNVAALRASLGSAAPFDILPAVWVTSFCSAGIGLVSAWLLGKATGHG